MTDALEATFAQAQARPRIGAVVRDFVALAKPRITTIVVLTTAGGLFLAPVRPSAQTTLSALIGVALIVAGANALNMVLERDVDRHMARTRNRPLPKGRLTMRQALIFGIVASVVAVPILALGVNALTALLAVLANVIYVLAYTPLKQRSHLALEVGAIPGAIPPLLGWTAATNRIDGGGLVLFAILFFWQLPHFHAIALFRREDYARAGLLVLPNTRGEDATKHVIVRYLAVLLAASLLLFPSASRTGCTSSRRRLSARSSSLGAVGGCARPTATAGRARFSPSRFSISCCCSRS